MNIVLKINSNDFFKTAERYGLNTFSILQDEEKNHAIFNLSNETNDKLTIQYISEVLAYIFNSKTVNHRDLNYAEDKEVLIDIYTVFLAFIDFMKDKYDDKHYMERIREYANIRAVEMVGGIPKIHWLDDGTFMITPCCLINGEICFNDKIIKNKVTEANSVRSKSTKRAAFRNFKWDNLYNSCQLFRDFKDGKRCLTHSELLLIARNLCGAEKGKNEFLDIIESNDCYVKNNWKEMLNGIIKGNIPIQECENCMYSEECCHCRNMLETANPKAHDIKQINQPEYVDIKDAEDDLKDKFNQAINSGENGIHIIKAQTGLGKTSTYIDYLKVADNPCVIAVPTHELKEEIYHRAMENGIKNICCTPAFPESLVSEDISEKVNHLYAIGAAKEVMPYLGDLLNRLHENDNDYIVIKDYLETTKNSVEFKGHIITTHAKLILKSDSSFSDHEIIVDEDILRQVYNTGCVKISDIRKILNKEKSLENEVGNRLNVLLHKQGYMVENKDAEINITNEFNGINADIYGLLNAEVTYSDSERVIFINRQRLSYSKMIILSATVDPSLYKMFFPERKIISYECKKSRYEGEVIQYTDSSYSRFNLINDKEKVEKLVHKLNGKSVITFQSIQEKFDTKYHFGNIEGLNIFEGNDLFIIGLPNLPEKVYKLYGLCLNCNMKSKMRPQRIEYNGYSFRINTFDDLKLRQIQMWLLSSQLEQSVGRARLLRNNCTVTVYSEFPVEQAVYINQFK